MKLDSRYEQIRTEHPCRIVIKYNVKNSACYEELETERSEVNNIKYC